MAGRGGFNGKLSADAKLQHALECVMQAAGRVESAMRGEPGSAERAAAVQAMRVPYSGRVGVMLQAADMLQAYAGVLDQLADKYGLGALLDFPADDAPAAAELPGAELQARADKAFSRVPEVVAAELRKFGRVDCGRVAELCGPAELHHDLAVTAYRYLQDNWGSVGEFKSESVGDYHFVATEATEVLEGLSVSSLSELSPNCSDEWRAAAIDYLAGLKSTGLDALNYRAAERSRISSSERGAAIRAARMVKGG